MVEIYEITNEIHRRITENPAIKNRFTKHIDHFCKMVEDYGQDLQRYADKLEKAKKRIDKFTPEQLEKYKCPDGKIRVSVVAVCPPPKDWVHTNWDDNSFINVDIGVIYRPKEPVNPLLWFGVFDCNPSAQRNPEDDEKLMCEYVRLAIIHDYDLRYSGTPTDTPILSADYKGIWFRRNEFFEKVWYNYCQAEQNKLSQLERALISVRADLASEPKKDDKPKKLDYQHSEDYTSVEWFGNNYSFNKTQALCVGYLWAEWEKDKGFGLSEKTVGENIGSDSGNYKLKHTFRAKQGKKYRQHPAWGKMIVSCGKGVFRLKSPKK